MWQRAPTIADECIQKEPPSSGTIIIYSKIFVRKETVAFHEGKYCLGPRFTLFSQGADIISRGKRALDRHTNLTHIYANIPNGIPTLRCKVTQGHGRVHLTIKTEFALFEKNIKTVNSTVAAYLPSLGAFWYMIFCDNPQFSTIDPRSSFAPGEGDGDLLAPLQKNKRRIFIDLFAITLLYTK